MCDDNRPVVGMICRVGIVEEKSSYVVIMLVVACLNDKQLLNLVAGIALADAVPGGEGEGAAEGPHDRDCDFGGVGSLGLRSHFHHAGGAAGRAGGVEAHGGGSDALGCEGSGDRGAGGNAGEHVWICACVFLVVLGGVVYKSEGFIYIYMYINNGGHV